MRGREGHHLVVEVSFHQLKCKKNAMTLEKNVFYCHNVGMSDCLLVACM